MTNLPSHLSAVCALLSGVCPQSFTPQDCSLTHVWVGITRMVRLAMSSIPITRFLSHVSGPSGHGTERTPQTLHRSGNRFRPSQGSHSVLQMLPFLSNSFLLRGFRTPERKSKREAYVDAASKGIVHKERASRRTQYVLERLVKGEAKKPRKVSLLVFFILITGCRFTYFLYFKPGFLSRHSLQAIPDLNRLILYLVPQSVHTLLPHNVHSLMCFLQ